MYHAPFPLFFLLLSEGAMTSDNVIIIALWDIGAGTQAMDLDTKPEAKAGTSKAEKGVTEDVKEGSKKPASSRDHESKEEVKKEAEEEDEEEEANGDGLEDIPAAADEEDYDEADVD